MRAPLLAIALTAAAVGACQLTVEFDRSRIEDESLSDPSDAGARTDGSRIDGGDGGDGGTAKPPADASTPDASTPDAALADAG